jgi:hypothetical protein
MKTRNTNTIFCLASFLFLILLSNNNSYASNSNAVNGSDRQLSASAEGATSSLIRFTAGYSDSPDSYDPFVVYFSNLSTYDFDGQYDALKLFNTDSNVTNFYVFGNDNSKLSIDALPFDGSGSTCALRCGLKTEKDGTIVFKIKDISGIYSEMSIYLIDNELKTITNLLSGSEYKVFLQAGDYTTRFIITLSNVLTYNPETVISGDELKAYVAQGVLRTEISLLQERDGLLTLCNMNGYIVFNRNVSYSGNYDFTPAVRDGIYIISLTSGGERVSHKIYFHH